MDEERHRDKLRRPPILIAIGFLGAFLATVLTVILTGLYVRGPGAARSTSEQAPPAELDVRPDAEP